MGNLAISSHKDDFQPACSNEILLLSQLKASTAFKVIFIAIGWCYKLDFSSILIMKGKWSSVNSNQDCCLLTWLPVPLLSVIL